MSKLILNSEIKHDNYTQYICDKFDLTVNETITTEIPMINQDLLNTFNWNIGLICGNSGSGKSTILSYIGDCIKPIFDKDKSIVSQFTNFNEEEVVELLTSVGLSSIPIWLHKPNELSNGEKSRLDICWYLYMAKQTNQTILIDEFTSVVNRDCAKSLSFALQRYVRKHNIKVILSSCHYDIIEWLNPDWIFNLNKQKDGECDIERMIYADDSEYDSYNRINNNDILTQSYEVC